MEKIKKTLLGISLSTLAISCLLLILSVFGVKVFEGVLFRILLISSTLAVACGLAINELNVIRRKKILGLVGLGLLGLSVLFALIIFCSNLLMQYNIFNQITSIIAISSVLFIVIIALYSKFGKRMLPLQIITYICLIILDILLSLLIAGVKLFEINGILELFIVLIIISVGLLIASSVISSKIKNTTTSNVNDKDAKITILKSEYDALKEENARLKKQLAELQK